MFSTESHETNESRDYGEHGKNYEKEISKFVFKRLLDKNYDTFRFTREIKGIGKFDDLAVITESKGVKKCYFMQLKHISDDESKKITSESLTEDCKSPFFLPKYFKHYVDSLPNISGDSYLNNSEVEFILCTNIEFEDNLHCIKIVETTNDDSLFEDSGTLYKLEISPDNFRKLFGSNFYLSDQEKLAKDLCYHIMLEKHLDINCLEIAEDASLIKKYHVALAENVIDVKLNKFKMIFLNEGINENNISFRNILIESFDNFYDDFKDMEILELKQNLNITKKRAENLQKTLKEYSSKSPIEFLKNRNLPLKNGFGDSKNLPEDLPTGGIQASEVDAQITQFLNSLTFAVGQRNNAKQILEEMGSENFLAFSKRIDNWYNNESYLVSEKKKIRKRKWITKEKLAAQAMNSLIDIGSMNIQLNQLVSDINCLDSEILMKTFSSVQLRIGCNFGREHISDSNYISRHLGRRRRLNKNQEDTEIVPEENLLKENNNIIILGEPGMGKSKLLKNMASLFDKKNKSNENPIWVIQIIFKDVIHIFENADGFKEVDDVIKLLAEMENVDSNSYKGIFRHCLLNERLVLLLDGYDEIPTESQRTKVCTFLNCLQNKCKVKQIWISSRYHHQDSLENVLKVVSYHIENFSEEQQIDYLREYWILKSNRGEDHIRQYTPQIVRDFNMQMKSHERIFLGIPLQTYIFGIVFLQEIDKDKPDIHMQSLSSLFLHYFHVKYDIYLKKYGPFNIPSDIKSILIKSLDSLHQNLALKYGGILPACDAKVFITKDDMLSHEILIDIGIVYKVNNKFHFMHKTFAEYLTAKRMFEAIQLEEKSLYGEIIARLLHRNSNQFMLYLFDFEMTHKYPLFRSILNRDANICENHDVSDITQRDCVGRNILYYLFQYRHFSITESILIRIEQSSDDLMDFFFFISAFHVVLYSWGSYCDSDPEYQSTPLMRLFQIFRKCQKKLIEIFNIEDEIKKENWCVVEEHLETLQMMGLTKLNRHYLDEALKHMVPHDIMRNFLEIVSLDNQEVHQSSFREIFNRNNSEFIGKLWDPSSIINSILSALSTLRKFKF